MNALGDLADTRVRLAAFAWLQQQVRIHGDVLPWALLAEGFHLDGKRVPLVSQQGIFKPQVLPELPLTIRTSPGAPYHDHARSDDLLVYSYRGTDPNHRENRGLREAMQRQVPLIYLLGLLEGRYLAVWPVFVVADDPGALSFIVAADEASAFRAVREGGFENKVSYSAETELRRRYVTRQVRSRAHQRGFRERVLAAYHAQCALCRLRHPELLDAAHIIADTEDLGEPRVPNGLSLCRLHHCAFDAHFITVRPDYSVEVRQSILEEHDGPMLRHGLQGVHNTRIWTPRSSESKPDRGLLELRYEQFRKAG